MRLALLLSLCIGCGSTVQQPKVAQTEEVPPQPQPPTQEPTTPERPFIGNMSAEEIEAKREEAKKAEEPSVRRVQIPEWCAEFKRDLKVRNDAWYSLRREAEQWKQDNCVRRDYATGYQTVEEVGPTGIVTKRRIPNAGVGLDCSGSKMPANYRAILKENQSPSEKEYKKLAECKGKKL